LEREKPIEEMIQEKTMYKWNRERLIEYAKKLLVQKFRRRKIKPGDF